MGNDSDPLRPHIMDHHLGLVLPVKFASSKKVLQKVGRPNGIYIPNLDI